jgi:hypothetical protein
MAAGSNRYYISRDSGKSWLAIEKFGNHATHSTDPLAVDISRKWIYAIQDTGSSGYDGYVVVSRDSGKTWSSAGIENEVYNLAVGDEGDVIAYSGSDIYHKETASEGWNQLSSKWKLNGLKEILIGPDSTLYAGAKDGFWISENYGESWNHHSTLSDNMATDLIVGPDQKLYLLSDGVWQSEQQIVSSIAEGSENKPEKYKLQKNYPNPFNPKTQIQFKLTRSAEVELLIYDLLGRHVKTLIDGKRQAGRYTVTFDGQNLSSGVYIYRLKADGFSRSRKMLLVK